MQRSLRGVPAVIGMILFLLTALANPGYGQDDKTIREQRRELIPLDKLKMFLEAPKRVQTMQPERVLDVLGVKQGHDVADIGAGTGFFSFYLAGRVGGGGKVYAVEIEDELLEVIRGKMATQQVTNIIPVKSSESSPNLPQACCDEILIANTYIYFADPVAFMKTVRPALKPGGRVAIIEVDAAKAQSERKLLLQTKGRVMSEVIEEMKHAGFMLQASHDFLETRFFLIFSPMP